MIFFKRYISLLFLGCLGALGTAYVAEYQLGYKPCQLCLYERYVFMVLAVTCLLNLVTHKPMLIRLTLLAGLSLTFFHVGVEQKWFKADVVCSSGPIKLKAMKSKEDFKNFFKQSQKKQALRPPCSKINWTIFGYSATLWTTILFVFMIFGFEGVLWLSKRKK